MTAGREVRVRFQGRAWGAPLRGNTLKEGIERNIREKVPEVTQAVAVEN